MGYQVLPSITYQNHVAVNYSDRDSEQRPNPLEPLGSCQELPGGDRVSYQELSEHFLDSPQAARSAGTRGLELPRATRGLPGELPTTFRILCRPPSGGTKRAT